MKVEIYYTPNENRLARLLAAFTRGLCEEIPLQLIQHEIHHESTEIATASEFENKA